MTIIADPRMVYPDEANRLYDQLRRRGVIDSETGEAFTVMDCDAAIEYAVVCICEREGVEANALSITDKVWWMLLDAVAVHLEVGYDEIVEVSL